ncbi:MAG: hypothetical protein ACHQ53_03410 [Polyangiales bacterium]
MSERPLPLRFAPLALSAVTGATLLWAQAYRGSADATPSPGDLGVFRHALHHGLGLSPPRQARSPVRIDPTGLELADVVLASAAGNAYGHFSHATALMADGEVLGHNVLFGIFPMPLTDLEGYDHVRVLRAPLDAPRRREVARFLRTLPGAVFQLGARKGDARQWHCAKAVWAAFRRVGIDLAPDRDFIVPDDIARSAALRVVRDWRSP